MQPFVAERTACPFQMLNYRGMKPGREYLDDSSLRESSLYQFTHDALPRIVPKDHPGAWPQTRREADRDL